ncbi:MAG: DUF393 domain-containing protein [Nitrospira sp.]|nr:DUF393 domain-containing protein [Candidatus Manganitrophaceae bacterium]HIL34768.1 DUF393 domain-containing protein [Candidatus Manganitrophaceae bacterium]
MSNTSPRSSTKNKESGEHSHDETRNILIYDAGCRLCVRSKGILERWDRTHRIKFLPFQSEEARAIVPNFAGRSDIDAMRFVEADHPVSIGIDAFRRMLPLLPLGRVFSILFYLPGFPWLAGTIYRIVAKNRIRWFGSCEYK